MKKSLFIILAALISAFSAKADITADWKIHMPFDAWPVSVMETPTRVYFLSRTFEKSNVLEARNVPSHSLFYYDKEGEEIVSVNSTNRAYGNAVACIAYNETRNYLLVVYTDCNIDFLNDNGNVFNLPALQITSIPGKKEANFITFDDEGRRAYIATSFGYLALNDQKHEVAESRNYGVNVECVAKCGSNVVMLVDGQIYYAPASQQRFNISEYKVLSKAPAINVIVPLNSDDFIGYSTEVNGSMYKFSWTGTTYKWEEISNDTQYMNIQQIGYGYRLTGYVRMMQVMPTGELSAMSRPEETWRLPTAALKEKEVWSLNSRKGLSHYKRENSTWVPVEKDMRPNAPATYIASSAVYHPTYGMLVGSNGVDLALNNSGQNTPSNVSALKGGFWKEYGPLYTAPDKLNAASNYFGLAIDPANKNHVWRGSLTGGLMRLNLENPDDILIFGSPANSNADLSCFVKVAENQNVWQRLCRFSTPQFTSDGTMWTTYNNQDEGRAELWYWPAADRAATTSAATYRPMRKITVPRYTGTNTDVMITLNKTKNMAVIGSYSDGGSIIFFDHKGTPDVTADDRYVYMNAPYDQDGGSVSFLDINALAEDPETGMVWIMSQRGLFTVNPATVFDNPNQVNRIKVARNDGTNLADYLLNEINVNHMSIDGEGRKWFSTSNGLVCTSADGRSILGEFTVDNSDLPDNNIYVTCYNPENNSMIVATGGGIVEMFPSGSGGSANGSGSKMRAYPNPVEPDYYGWVRIDNIADGSLVKITDAKGGLVKELGPVQGGSVEWDVSGLNNTRVTTGVYYIMVSPPSTGGNTEVSKILVLN